MVWSKFSSSSRNFGFPVCCHADCKVNCHISKWIVRREIQNFSKMTKFSIKPKLLDIRNVMKKTACKRFLITLNHFRSRRCTLFFFILLIFFNSQHSSAPDRAQSWPRSGIFRNLSNFDRLYLRAQMDFFQNF